MNNNTDILAECLGHKGKPFECIGVLITVEADVLALAFSGGDMVNQKYVDSLFQIILGKSVELLFSVASVTVTAENINIRRLFGFHQITHKSDTPVGGNGILLIAVAFEPLHVDCAKFGKRGYVRARNLVGKLLRHGISSVNKKLVNQIRQKTIAGCCRSGGTQNSLRDFFHIESSFRCNPIQFYHIFSGITSVKK